VGILSIVCLASVLAAKLTPTPDMGVTSGLIVGESFSGSPRRRTHPWSV
jgi:hypothetical protein